MKALGIVFIILMGIAPSGHADPVQFRFGGDDFPPFAYLVDDRPAGLSVEILRVILDELQIPDTIKIYPWARVYQITLRNKNALMFTAARTEAREDLFKWVGPIAPRRIYLYKLKRRTDIEVDSFKDAKKYVVGTIRGYAAEKTLLDRGFEVGKNIHPVSENIQNFKKLYRGRIDLITSFDLLIAHTVKGTEYRLADFEKVLVLDDKYDFYYAFNRETDDAVVSRFQGVLDDMKADGRLTALLDAFLR